MARCEKDSEVVTAGPGCVGGCVFGCVTVGGLDIVTEGKGVDLSPVEEDTDGTWYGWIGM